MAEKPTKKLYRETLLMAYANGYFPMPNAKTQNIEWYYPDPRAVLPLAGFHCSRSLKKTIDRKRFRVTYSEAFDQVMLGCAERDDTWINKEFLRAYGDLHKHGFAHSLEVWNGSYLAGGTYGVTLGGAFFAESKFHRETDASKVALYFLVEQLKKRGFKLLEVQFLSKHLASLGAIEIPMKEYLKYLQDALKEEVDFCD